MGKAKLALAAMSCLVFIAHSAAANLAIDDFEEGPFMFSDVGRVGAGRSSRSPTAPIRLASRLGSLTYAAA